MANAKAPAQYTLDTTSVNVNVGDLVLAPASGASVTGVSSSVIGGHEGYDGGYLKIFVIEEKGSASISTASDVIHTGLDDAISASVSAYFCPQDVSGGYPGYGDTSISNTFATNLQKGDIILQWDEREQGHGNVRKDWEYSGSSRELYSNAAAIEKRVFQATSAGDMTKTDDCCTEHNAFKISLTTVPNVYNLSATPTSANEINVTWNCDRDPDAFALERKRRGGGDFSRIQTIGGSSRSYTDTNVGTSIPYLYRIWATSPSRSDVALDIVEEDVRVGDLVIMYENGSIFNVSNSTIINDIGADGGHLKVFLMRDNGTVRIDAAGDVEVIHIGHDNINSVDDYTVQISSENSSTGVFTSEPLNSGSIIIQWDESDIGDNNGYWSYSPSVASSNPTRHLYDYEGPKADRKVEQAFVSGDVERDATGVELATVSLDVSPGSILVDTFSEVSNVDDAKTGMPQIDVR